MRYGIPYKGSKNSIAKEIVNFLPDADIFYDLMCGGCAISHAAVESRKYKKVVINDIDPMPSQLFLDAMKGKYKDERRWISREDFYRLKDIDPYVKYCWSFGNNGRDYLYGQDVEEFKHGLHLAIFNKDVSLLENILGFSKGTIPLYENITDIQKRYAAYKKYLSSIGGGRRKFNTFCNPTKIQKG